MKNFDIKNYEDYLYRLMSEIIGDHEKNVRESIVITQEKGTLPIILIGSNGEKEIFNKIDANRSILARSIDRGGMPFVIAVDKSVGYY